MPLLLLITAPLAGMGSNLMTIFVIMHVHCSKSWCTLRDFSDGADHSLPYSDLLTQFGCSFVIFFCCGFTGS